MSEAQRQALDRYNNQLRGRYGLRAVRLHELDRVTWPVGDEEVDVSAFPDGLAAAIAQYVVRSTPRYAAGIIDADGQMHVTTAARGTWPTGAAGDGGGHFLASYPFGGADNLEPALEAFRVATRAAREANIVGLALREVPDLDPEWTRITPDKHGDVTYAPAVVERAMPGHLEQVAWVFDVGVSTLKAWRQTRRRELTAPRGRPRKDGRTA